MARFAFEMGVSSVYYESLGDHPRKHGELMGLFDKWGTPKLSYSYVRLVKSVIQPDGFCTVVNTSQVLSIVGRDSNRTLMLAHSDAKLVLSGTDQSVVAGSGDYDGQVLRRGEWMITCSTP